MKNKSKKLIDRIERNIGNFDSITGLSLKLDQVVRHGRMVPGIVYTIKGEFSGKEKVVSGDFACYKYPLKGVAEIVSRDVRNSVSRKFRQDYDFKVSYA